MSCRPPTALATTALLLLAACGASKSPASKPPAVDVVADCKLAEAAFRQQTALNGPGADYPQLITTLRARAAQYKAPQFRDTATHDDGGVVLDWSTYCLMSGHSWLNPGAAPERGDENGADGAFEPDDPGDANTVP